MIGFWLGDLATGTDLIPLNFFDWRVVPDRDTRAAMSIIEELKEGRSVGRGELFITTRKRRDGTYTSEEARTIAEQVSKKLREFEATQISDTVISTDDAVGQILGKEHSGRVRGLGLGACSSKVFGLPNHRLHHLNLSTTSNTSSSEDSLRLKIFAMQEKLECMQKERKFEQAERAREQAERARMDQMMKYLVQQLGIQLPPCSR